MQRIREVDESMISCSILADSMQVENEPNPEVSVPTRKPTGFDTHNIEEPDLIEQENEPITP